RIGTDKDGTLDLGNGAAGLIIQGAARNTVGGTAAGAGNLISGNNYGLLITESGAGFNLVQGNLIGTNATGASAIGNNFGLSIQDASNNTVGGTVPGAGNVISGNLSYGIWLREGATRIVVQGNFIGTNATGTADLGNSLGLLIEGENNLIGGGIP